MKRKQRAITRSVFLTGGVGISGMVFLWLTVTPAPSPALADEIDGLLEQDPCVRFADRWPSRFYVWERPSWAKHGDLFWLLSGPWLGSDTSKVSIRFHEKVVPDVYPSGQHLLRADQEQLWLDSSNDMWVYATYDVETRKLTSLRCGRSGG